MSRRREDELRRSRRREREESPIEEVQAEPEEIELEDFLDSIGGQGNTELYLYRILQTGKQVFVDSGPPSKFSEKQVQTAYGGGDYLVRSKLNGRWYRSKAFSVESLPGVSVSVKSGSHDSELERLKTELETQRLRLEQQQAQMEADRREREQRNHELFLKMLETRNSTAPAGPSLTELIAGVESLRNLSANGNGLAAFKEILEIADRINGLRVEDKEDDSFAGILKSAVRELAPGVAQAVMGSRSGGQVAVAGSSAQASQAVAAATEFRAESSIPTAYDQLAAQIRSLYQRVESQAAAGLEAEYALESLIELADQGDPVCRVIMNSVDRAATFESWSAWLRSQLGSNVVIQPEMSTFLSKLFASAKTLPKEAQQESSV